MEIIHIHKTALAIIVKTIHADTVTLIISPSHLIGRSERQEIIPVQTISISGFTVQTLLATEPDMF